MSKEHSDPDTKLSAGKFNKRSLSNLILERTYQAMQHYKAAKLKSELPQKQIFIQRNTTNNEEPEKRKQIQSDLPKNKRVQKRDHEKPTKKSQRKTVCRKNYKQPSLSQKSSSEQVYQVKQPDDVTNDKKILKVSVQFSQPIQARKQLPLQQPEHSEQGPEQEVFCRLPIHEALLEFQKIIDSFLDYQFVHRKKRSLPLQEMFSFLKSTKFSLNCKKYFTYLTKYNSQLYEVKENRIVCLELSGQDIETRVRQTNRNMLSICIKELMI